MPKFLVTTPDDSSADAGTIHEALNENGVIAEVAPYLEDTAPADNKKQSADDQQQGDETKSEDDSDAEGDNGDDEDEDTGEDGEGDEDEE